MLARGRDGTEQWRTNLRYLQRVRRGPEAAVRVARRHGLALLVRGGGHDWAGRANERLDFHSVSSSCSCYRWLHRPNLGSGLEIPSGRK
jgi:FAD/FMN-containing dehydrogenase